MNSLIIVGSIVTGVASFVTVLQIDQLRKNRKTMAESLHQFEQKKGVLSHNLILSEFRLKEAGLLNKNLKHELNQLKSQSTFVQKAIKAKVKKKKNRGKRRKSA